MSKETSLEHAIETPRANTEQLEQDLTTSGMLERIGSLLTSLSALGPVDMNLAPVHINEMLRRKTQETSSQPPENNQAGG
jgi:hypothetical protein